MNVEIILYVADQQRSGVFYKKILGKKPVIDVSGMTAFELNALCRLGLMPNSGIARILGDALPHPDLAIGTPRCELYLHVESIQLAVADALAAGAKMVSPAAERDWGDTVAYLADLDGHVIAFAKKLSEQGF